MGEEDTAPEVAKAVANGTILPDKAGPDVSDTREGETEVVDEKGGDGDGKDDEKSKEKEINVDNKDAEASENTKGGETKELKERNDESKEKGKDEPRIEKTKADNEYEVKPDEDKKKEEEAPVDIEKEKGSKKRARKKKDGEEGNAKKKATEEKKGKEKKENEPKTPVGLTMDRPVRERKSVERLVAVIEMDNSREIRIEKGRGTALKDIPNVAYKLSKKKAAEETLKLLHTVLFGRRGKAMQIKSNILRFSGFVWHDHEEKQKLKMKEKLDKYSKEKLSEFCDLLDIPITEATTKEEIIEKLVDFLLVPHATTSELIAEKEQSSKGKKRPRVSKKSGGSTSEGVAPKSSSKKQKSESQSKEDKTEGTKESKEEENNNDDDDTSEDSESEEHESEPEPKEEEKESKKQKLVSKKTSSKKEKTPPKTKPKKDAKPKASSPSEKKTKAKPSTSGSKDNDQSEPSPKTFSRKKKSDAVDEKCFTPKKSASKEKAGKKAVKDEKKAKARLQSPSDDELRVATSEILKVVDFNTATFTDILKHLVTRFNLDLTPRKATIKIMIQDELTKLADESSDVEDEDEDEDEDGPRKQTSEVKV